ncbi:2-O-methyltransferase NoeI [Rubripirellula amarantea]|uniref:2-O-methyltransferase NoeI n=1 Tax=Rubripirellula amarantea TaxID=2527999 RepID=A0A5C5WUQ4_9BACT|nr:FkbM family methyltransferase [Rubripirellula amarantea]TWT53733.1 2-O-methyltransferase NoeI [Rubripirellula amarantea]
MSRSLYAAKIPFRTAYLQLANRFGKPSSHVSMLHRYGVDTVLDVGANNGQYARRLLRGGFRGRIISFEPLPAALEKLRLNSSGFDRWQVASYALGAETTTAKFNVATDTQSSSLLPMTDRLESSTGDVCYVDTITINVKRLDEIVSSYCEEDERLFLKLDVQGLEHQVIAGAQRCMDQIIGMQMELSTQPLYENAPLWDESLQLAESLDFVPTSIQSGFSDRVTGVMLQADCTFVRQSVANDLALAKAS